MMNKIIKNLIIFVITFTVVMPFLTTKAEATNVIPAEVVKTADPIKIDDTSFTQQVIIKFPSENQNRTEAIVFNYPKDVMKVPLKQGDRVSVKVDPNASSKYEVIGYDRFNDLLWLPALFIAVYIVIIGAKNIKRLALQFLTIAVSLGALYLGITTINHPLPFVLVAIIVTGIIYFLARFKRRTLTFISGLSFTLSIVVLFIISFFLVDLLKIQNNIIGPLLSFYSLIGKVLPNELIVSCILIGATGGIMSVISYEVREGVALKAKESNIERNKLIIRSARMGIRILQEKTFTFFTLMIGLLALFVAPFLTATNIPTTFNFDPIASLVSFLFLILLGWLITVPITSVIVGFVLGRVQSHKLVTSETLDEFEGFM